MGVVGRLGYSPDRGEQAQGQEMQAVDAEWTKCLGKPIGVTPKGGAFAGTEGVLAFPA